MPAVKNTRAIGNTKPIPVIHFIPPRFAPVYKIEIVTDTETLDVTDRLVNGEYTDGVTESIGDFALRFLDPNNTVSNKVEEFDTINIYLDYGTTATTKRFSGKIEKKANSEQIYFDISGRSIAMITTGVNVTYNSDGEKSRSTILKEIIAKYFSGTISVTGIEEDTGLLNVNYSDIPFWSVVEAISNDGGRDSYISSELVFNYFERGSRTNITEAIVENINLVDSVDYGKDTEEMVTEVKCYGSASDGIPVLSTSESNTTNTKGIVKQLKIDNNGAIDTAQTSYIATSEFNNKSVAPTIGEVISLMTPTLLPGEKINIANPTNNIRPAAYEVNSFRHFFKEDDVPQTIVTIKKRKLDISKILKSNITFQHDITESSNPNEMNDSVIYNFANNEGTFVNTERSFISSGEGGYYVLKTTSGNTGNWTSPLYEFGYDIEAIEFRISGEALPGITGTKIQYSLDGGISFYTWGASTLEVNSINSLMIRVIFSSSETQVKAVGALYK